MLEDDKQTATRLHNGLKCVSGEKGVGKLMVVWKRFQASFMEFLGIIQGFGNISRDCKACQ